MWSAPCRKRLIHRLLTFDGPETGQRQIKTEYAQCSIHRHKSQLLKAECCFQAIFALLRGEDFYIGGHLQRSADSGQTWNDMTEALASMSEYYNTSRHLMPETGCMLSA